MSPSGPSRVAQRSQNVHINEQAGSQDGFQGFHACGCLVYVFVFVCHAREMTPPLQVGEPNLPLAAEDGSETVTQALVAVGVTGSSLDLEPAMTKILVKALLYSS